MRQDHSILQELKAIAPGLADIPKPGNGSVPENYFRELQDAVWAGIQIQNDALSATEELQSLAPVLSGIKLLTPEPEHIDFDRLQNTVLQKVFDKAPVSALEELQAIAPSLTGTPKSHAADTLPEGYFNDMQNQVLEQSGLSKPVRRFRLGFTKSSWYSWSAAASVLLLLAVGWWWMSPSGVSDNSNEANASLALTEEEILTYLTLDQEGLDAGMLLALDDSIVEMPEVEQKVPEKEVSEKNNIKKSNPKSKSGTSVEEEELDQLLNELDADDLENLF